MNSIQMSDLLAFKGSFSVRKTELPYGRQWIHKEDIQAVADILRGDYLTTKSVIECFENAVAEYTGVRYAVAFSSGTAALHGACFAAGIEKGDEVITTPLTFTSGVDCVLYQGGIPVYADVLLDTFNIDPESVEPLITEKTKAIIAEDFAGLPCDAESIRAIAKRNNLIFIEDASHSLGAVYKSRRIGSFSDMIMFSFHPVKHITAGEWGVIATDNEVYYEKLRQFRSHWITKDVNKSTVHSKTLYYEMQFIGRDHSITDIQAALGLSQLKKLKKFIKIKRKYAKIYTQEFKDMEEIICPGQPDNIFSSWHFYVIRLNIDKIAADRKDIIEALFKENIGVQVNDLPVYCNPCGQGSGYIKGSCPNAEKLYEEMIILPLFPAMSKNDVIDVVRAVKKAIS